LLVLDGLDAVAAPETRDRTLDAISGFLIDAAQVEADLLIVATTRPQGYRDEFSPKHYQHVTLQVMDPGRSLEYAECSRRVSTATRRPRPGSTACWSCSVRCCTNPTAAGPAA
jgi:hypothetical protein